MMNMVEAQKQTFGVEIEMNNITREKAAKLAAEFFGTGRYEDTASRNGYCTWSAWMADGREWKFQKDVSIAGPDSHKCEMVTPILTYEDMETLQELVRILRKAGAKSDASRMCGVHIHIGAKGHTPQTLRNLANIMASHESLIAEALDLDHGRMNRYCKTVDPKFLEVLNKKKPDTMAGFADIWYTKDAEGNLVIDPEQAEIVRRIYREYLEGASFLQIKRSLEADSIPNGAGHLKWHESNIQQILTNEKYIGDALLQKTYTVSVLDKKRSTNNGQRPKYYVEGSHEAIISKDVFMRVQSEIARRANLSPDGKRRVYSSKYALSGMVYCGHCGDIYRRVKWNNRGCKSTVWRCVSRVLKKDVDFDCPARTIKEDVLQGAIVTAVNDAYARNNIVTALLKQNIESTVFGDLEERLAMADKELADLQAQMIAVSGDEAAVDALGDQIDGLRAERQSILAEAAERSELQERMNDMISFLDEMPTMLTEYSDAITRRLVEKITIYDEKIVVELKSGLQMEVEA